MSFFPFEERASVGGYEWRYDLADAEREYEDFVSSTEGTHVVRLLEIETPFDAARSRDVLLREEINEWFERHIDDLETVWAPLKERVPA